MKLSTIFVILMVVIAMFVSQTSAAPRIKVKDIRRGGKVIVSILLNKKYLFVYVM